MTKTKRAAHVATTRRKYKDKVYETHLLRRTYREDGKVKHETLANLSHLPEHVIELIRQALKGKTFVSAEDAFQIKRSLPHGHVAAVLATLRKIGLERIIYAKKSRERDLVVALITARIVDPRSKLATARGLDEETSTLAQILNITDADEEDLYRAMDWLLERQPHIEKKLAAKHLNDTSKVFYDLTSTYFEGSSCPLARIGYSRDGKKNKPQIVFGLMTDGQGRPVAVEVFSGNTADPATIATQVTKIRKRFRLARLILVGDRGMITAARIREDLSPEGLDWITSLRAPEIKKLAEAGEIQLSLFDEHDLVEIKHPDCPGERLIVCRNPLLAQRRAQKREDLLQATERELNKIIAATSKGRLRDEAKIGLRAGRVLGRFKMAKHFDLHIAQGSFSYERKQPEIAKEAALDGLYVIRTNVPETVIEAEEAVGAYKNLAVVERAFRRIKTVDLKVRPIYHRLEKRVRAHVFLCMLAYYVEWHLRDSLAPLLFHDEDPAGAQQLRDSPVSPARRSPSAEKKARERLTPDGLPVHDFQGLLKALGTLTKNQVCLVGSEDAEFTQYAQPTALQQRAFELLEVSYQM